MLVSVWFSLALAVFVSLLSFLFFVASRLILIGVGKPIGDRKDEAGEEANIAAAAARGEECGWGMGRNAERAAASRDIQVPCRGDIVPAHVAVVIVVVRWGAVGGG